MSPILTRPIREQFEHDRIIRQLQLRYKRKHEVVINPGGERNQSVMVGDLAVYPDLLLFSLDRGRQLEGTVEVETGESVNQLEALAEWGVFSKLKAPFHLYVPPQSLDSARRICEEHAFPVAEIWTYHLALDQVRFTQAYRSPAAAKASAPAAKRPVEKKAPAARARTAARTATKTTAKSAAKSVAKPATKPAARKKSAPVRPAARTSKAAARPKEPRKTASKGTPARKRR